MSDVIVKFIRLNTGEDIISEIQSIDDNTIRLIYPMKIIYSMNQALGLISVSLVQWVFPKISELENFDMNTSNILLSSIASVGITEYYYSITKQTADKDEMMTDEDEDELTEYMIKKEEQLRRQKRLH